MRMAGWRRLRVLLAGVIAAGGILAGQLAAPSITIGVGPLPDCKLQDILTIPRGYDDWATTLVDWNLTLGKDYKPPDLVNVRDAGVRGSGYIRQVAFADLKALAAAATAHGTPLVSWSAYRSYTQQLALFNGYAGYNSTTKTYTNYDAAVQFSARPGHSEHQTGLTIDFVAVGDHGLTSNWEVTKTGSWMAKNAWKYGWLMSYPKGKQDVVCYSYEPWHYRYYGRELAKKIHDSGLTAREYLWANFTQLDASGNPVATATTAPSAAPTLPATSSAPAPSLAAGETPVPTAPATQAPTSAGSQPNLGLTLVLVALVVIGVVASISYLRRRQRSQSRRWR